MQINRVALDLAKQVIQVHAVDRSGRALVRKAVRRVCTEAVGFEPPGMVERHTMVRHGRRPPTAW